MRTSSSPENFTEPLLEEKSRISQECRALNPNKGSSFMHLYDPKTRTLVATCMDIFHDRGSQHVAPQAQGSGLKGSVFSDSRARFSSCTQKP